MADKIKPARLDTADKHNISDSEVEAINKEFEDLCYALKKFRSVTAKNNSPIRGVFYRVLKNGETRCHVQYQRVKRNP